MYKNHPKIWRSTNLINIRGYQMHSMQCNIIQCNQNGCYISVTQPYSFLSLVWYENMSWEIILFWNHFIMHTLYLYRTLNTVGFRNINIFPIFDKLAETVEWKILMSAIKKNQHKPSGYNTQGVYRKSISLEIFNIHFNERNLMHFMVWRGT